MTRRDVDYGKSVAGPARGSSVTFLHVPGAGPPLRSGSQHRGAFGEPWRRPLWAVLNAMVDQVGLSRRDRLGMSGRDSMTLLDLAMAFKTTDTGVVGDAFEWAVLRAIRDQDAAVVGPILNAIRMTLPNFKPTTVTAVLVAAERTQFADVLEVVGASARLARPTRGRPPSIATVLRGATTRNWKADLLIGEPNGQFVGATLKSNRGALRDIRPDDPRCHYPPAIGITVDRPYFRGTRHMPQTSIEFNDHGLPVVSLATDRPAIAGIRSVLTLVMDHLERDFQPRPDARFLTTGEQELVYYLDRNSEVPLDQLFQDLLEDDPLLDYLAPPSTSGPEAVLWRNFDDLEPGSAPSAIVLASDVLVSTPWN